MDNSLYHQAPDLILEKTAEVRNQLSKQKNKETESYKFWFSVAEVMRLAFNYIQDMKHVYRQNEVLTAENAFLRHYTKDLSDRLSVYENIRAEMAAGTLDETINTVKNAANVGD